MLKTVTVAAIAAAAVLAPAGGASATIHPIVQSVNCAAAEAWEHTAVGDPAGQTPAGFSGEDIIFAFPFLIVVFPTPLTFDQSDFRALIATGVVDEVVLNTSGQVTQLKVDLTSLPKAVSGEGGNHCKAAS